MTQNRIKSPVTCEEIAKLVQQLHGITSVHMQRPGFLPFDIVLEYLRQQGELKPVSAGVLLQILGLSWRSDDTWILLSWRDICERSSSACPHTARHATLDDGGATVPARLWLTDNGVNRRNGPEGV